LFKKSKQKKAGGGVVSARGGKKKVKNDNKQKKRGTRLSPHPKVSGGGGRARGWSTKNKKNKWWGQA